MWFASDLSCCLSITVEYKRATKYSCPAVINWGKFIAFADAETLESFLLCFLYAREILILSEFHEFPSSGTPYFSGPRPSTLVRVCSVWTLLILLLSLWFCWLKSWIYMGSACFFHCYYWGSFRTNMLDDVFLSQLWEMDFRTQLNRT